MRRGASGLLSCVLASVFSLSLSAQDSEVSSPLAERIAKLNQELLGTLPGSGRAFSLQSSDNQLTSLIEQRSEALEELVGLDAAQALALALPEEQLKRLRLAYPELAGELESRGEWQGALEYWIADDFESGTSWPVYRLDLEPEGVEVSFASSEPPGLAAGDLVGVRGLKIGPRVAASESFIVAPAVETVGCSTTGEQRIAVIMVTYPDEPVPQVSLREIRDGFFSSSQMSLGAYWREASYGKTYATGDVFGWFILPRAYSCERSASEYELLGAAIEAADEQVDFTEYNRIFILAPWKKGCLRGRASGCGTQTSPSDGTFTASFGFLFNEPMFDELPIGIAAHEGGHMLGLGHASSLDFGDITLGFAGESGTHTEYGDRFSAMGGSIGHYSARHKFQLGWLENGTEIETVEESGVFTLSPLSSSVAGLKALRVRRATGSDEWLWVEYRQPIGPYEQHSPEQGFSGALIHYEGPLNRDPDKARTHILDLTPQSTRGRFEDGRDWNDPALAVGETWKDIFSSRTIEVLSKTSDSLTVSVRQEPSCVSLSPESREHGPEAATGTVSISAAPSCSWEVHASEPWITMTSALNGSGSGELEYSIGRNEEFEPRAGLVSVGRQFFRIAQTTSFVNVPPRFVSVIPNSGEGYNQIFSVLVDDANGVDDLGAIYLSFGTVDGPSKCEVIVQLPDGDFLLRADEGLDRLSPVEGRLENSSCSLNLGTSSTTRERTEARVLFDLTFKAAFEGPKEIRGRTADRSEFYRSIALGTWTVGPGITPPFTSAGLVHSARFEAGDVAAQEIVSLFGLFLADFNADAVLPLGTQLGGASVDVTDSQGVTRPCLMLAARVETDISPAQLNFIIAAGTATGPAILTARRASGEAIR